MSEIGLQRGTVALFPHNEAWHRLFEEEASRLKAVIGPTLVAIEHIGSTSICGISAKPILDIMVGVEPFEADFAAVPEIEGLGYEYKGENGVPMRHYFGKGEPRTVHLSVVEYGGEFWQVHLAFRDCLRRDPQAALEYDELKRSLAEQFPNDRDSYTNGKLDFVNQILSLSRNK